MGNVDFNTWRQLFLADHNINQAEVFFNEALTDKKGKVVFAKLTINQLLNIYEGDQYAERNLKRVISSAVYQNKNVGRELNRFVANEIELGNSWLIEQIVRLNKR